MDALRQSSTTISTCTQNGSNYAYYLTKKEKEEVKNKNKLMYAHVKTVVCMYACLVPLQEIWLFSTVETVEKSTKTIENIIFDG